MIPSAVAGSRARVPSVLARVTVESIEAANGRLVILGHERNPYRAALWASSDGTAWSEVRAPTGFLGNPYGQMQIVVGPKGWLLAAYASDGKHLWWSPDGIFWSVAAEPATGELAVYAGQLAAAPWGFVVPTRDSDCASDVWVSSEAKAWTCSGGPHVPVFWDPDWRFAASDRAIVGIRPGGDLWVTTTPQALP